MKKRLIAITLTIFLGAGMGHLYLKKFLKGIILILANLAIASTIVWRVFTDPSFSSWFAAKANEPLEKFIEAYNTATVGGEGGISGLAHILMWHDLALAAILAYALVDIWRLTSDNTRQPGNNNHTGRNNA